MSDDQLTRLFKYMQKEFKAIRSELHDETQLIREDISNIYSVLDSYLKRTETLEQESLIRNHQLGKHDDWICRAAKELNITFNR